MNDNYVSVPREEYNILMVSQATLDHIRVILAADPCSILHMYSADSCRVVDALLGIERKEEAD